MSQNATENADDLKKKFCLISIQKEEAFTPEDFWRLQFQIMRFVETVASPMMLYPSFEKRGNNRFRLMFECSTSVVDIIENWFYYLNKREIDLTIKTIFNDT